MFFRILRNPSHPKLFLCAFSFGVRHCRKLSKNQTHASCVHDHVLCCMQHAIVRCVCCVGNRVVKQIVLMHRKKRKERKRNEERKNEQQEMALLKRIAYSELVSSEMTFSFTDHTRTHTHAPFGCLQNW